MSKRIDQAIRKYQATVAPKAIKEALEASDRCGLIIAKGIRMVAASVLLDVLAEEIAR